MNYISWLGHSKCDGAAKYPFPSMQSMFFSVTDVFIVLFKRSFISFQCRQHEFCMPSSRGNVAPVTNRGGSGVRGGLKRQHFSQVTGASSVIGISNLIVVAGRRRIVFFADLKAALPSATERPQLRGEVERLVGQLRSTVESGGKAKFVRNPSAQCPLQPERQERRRTPRPRRNHVSL
jgi:hypothetical protein